MKAADVQSDATAGSVDDGRADTAEPVSDATGRSCAPGCGNGGLDSMAGVVLDRVTEAALDATVEQALVMLAGRRRPITLHARSLRRHDPASSAGKAAERGGKAAGNVTS